MLLLQQRVSLATTEDGEDGEGHPTTPMEIEPRRAKAGAKVIATPAATPWSDLASATEHCLGLDVSKSHLPLPWCHASSELLRVSLNPHVRRHGRRSTSTGSDVAPAPLGIYSRLALVRAIMTIVPVAALVSPLQLRVDSAASSSSVEAAAAAAGTALSGPLLAAIIAACRSAETRVRLQGLQLLHLFCKLVRPRNSLHGLSAFVCLTFIVTLMYGVIEGSLGSDDTNTSAAKAEARARRGHGKSTTVVGRCRSDGRARSYTSKVRCVLCLSSYLTHLPPYLTHTRIVSQASGPASHADRFAQLVAPRCVLYFVQYSIYLCT